LLFNSAKHGMSYSTCNEAAAACPCNLSAVIGLPSPLRQDWRLLFNSAKHGMSYSTFLGRLGDASPTLLLVRDKGGAVFGGIAHAPWQKTGTFYGE
jgi:hypothetical protein